MMSCPECGSSQLEVYAEKLKCRECGFNKSVDDLLDLDERVNDLSMSVLKVVDTMEMIAENLSEVRQSFELLASKELVDDQKIGKEREFFPN